MNKARALSELRPIYEERNRRPLTIKMAGMERAATLPELGATFDAAAAVEAAYKVGRSGNWIERVSTQLGALARGHEVESPGISMDRPKLQAYINQQAAAVDRSVKDAELVVGADQSVKVTSSVVGRKLDVAGSLAAVEKALVSGGVAVELPIVETKPKRVEQDLEDARGRLSKMFSGPVGLEFNDKQWALSMKEIAALVTVEQKAEVAAPTISLQEQPLVKMVDRIGDEIDQSKINARYDWNGGHLTLLKPGQDGRKVNREKALAALKEAIGGDQRVVALPVDVEKAAGGSLDPSSLGITERIDFGKTTIAGVPEKIHNIKLAASRLNGVLLAPGDTFSFNRELGPTTLKSGFQTGFGISVANGQMETVPSVAGGICQVATTLLHAVFWAGYQIEERYPHLYWIQSYGQPPRGITGLDATVDDPTLDFKFVNNTENFLLIQTSTANNQLEFSLYGTKPTWKVDVEGPIISNVKKADPAMVTQYESSWPVGKQLQVERATDGMDVVVIRRVTQGSDVRTLTLKSPYQPSRNVMMVGGSKPQPGAAADATPSTTPQPQAPTPPPASTPGSGVAATATTAPAATPVPPAATPKPPAVTPAPASATRAPAPGTPTPRPTPRS